LPRLYNNGVTAYQSNDFTQAATAFENATASTDRTLQQRALYNLGNTSYRLGEAQPAQAQQLWQRAIKDYESALAIDPQDPDAKFNHEFVKKKLEELKKQQQEQQRQNQKNQQDNKQDQKKDEQKQQQQNSKDKQSEQQKQQQSQQSQEQEQKEKQQEQQAQQQKSSPPKQQPPENGGQPENYDKMQATALLNDLRENEQNWNFFPEVQMKDLKDSGETAKDW
jgi:Ca-activated chloride channel family protein